MAVATPTSSAPTKPGPQRDRDHVHAIERGVSRGERVVDDGPDQVEVMARGDLRDHAAVAIVDPLGRDHVGPDLAVLGDDRRAGVVAAGLEREDHPDALGVDAVSAVRHMITASSPVSW